MADKGTADTSGMAIGEKFRLLVENVGAGIAFYDNNGTLVSCNSAEADSLGDQMENLVGKSVFDIFDPQYADTVFERIRRALEVSEEPGIYEDEISLPAGTARCLSIYSQVTDKEGHVTGVGTISLDIPAKKEAGEAVAEYRKRLADIIDFLPDATLAIDRDGRVIAWNRAIEEMTGVSASEILGKGDHEYSIPFYGKRRPILIDLVLKTDEEFEREYDYIKRDGDRITSEAFVRAIYGGKGGYLWGTATPLYDQHGNCTGAIEVIRDITARKEAEARIKALLAEVQEEKEWLSSLLNSIPDEVWFTDASRRFTLANPQARNEFSLKETDMPVVEALAESLEIYRPDGTPRPVDEAPSLRALAGEVIRGMEEIIRTPRTGKLRYRQVSSSPVRDSSGEIVGSVSVVRDITEMKRADEEIRENEERFRSLFANMSSGVAIMEAVGDGEDFVFKDINKAAERIENVRREDVIGHSVLEIFPAIKEFGLFDVFQRVWETGVAEDHPVSFYKDERISGWRDNYVLKLPSGEVVAIYEDVTEQKRAEEQQALLSAIIQYSNEGILGKTLDGVITSWNTGAERIFGYTAGEMIGESVSNLVPPGNPDDTWILLEKVRAGEPVTHFETRWLTKDGRIIDVSLTVSPIKDADDNLIGASTIIHDITEQKAAEEELRQSEERFRSYIENAPDGIFLSDAQGNYTMVNDAACEITGYSRDELLEKNLMDIVHPDDHALGDGHFRKVSEEGQATVETRFVRKNGDTGYWLVKAVKIDEDNLLGFTSDITNHKLMESEIRSLNTVLEQKVEERTEELVKEISRRKKIEYQLRMSLEEKSVLLREIHHRVKNNLQIIISLTNLQLRQSDDPHVKQIISETQNRVRAMALVHEKLYKSETLSDIDLAEYIRFLARQLFSNYQTDSRKVALEIGIGEIMVPINTAIPIGLIINELVSNALKHAFPGERKGSLSILATREDNTISLKVADTGIGIPEELDWRNAPTLGLKLVISLVNQLDGSIELDRSQGTAFSIVVQVKE